MATQIPYIPSGAQESGAKERFFRYFQEEVTEIQAQISELGNTSVAGGERNDAIDHCLARITRLSNDVSDRSAYIPPYDQKIYSQAIKALSETLDETRSAIAPRPRFQFKTTHKNESAISLNDAEELAQKQSSQSHGDLDSSNESSMATTPANLKTPPSEDTLSELPSFPKNYNEEMARGPGGPIRKPSFSEAMNINISGHRGLHIILPSTASRATSAGTITKLTRCIVDMSEPTANGTPFAGLSLQTIKNSLVIAGHVAGAAHITGVEDSIILVASRQVRMHQCKNVDIYLHCASRPIIEDCTNIRFSPIPTCHKTSAETSIENHWDQVDDFKWLKAEPSPNWSILPEELRLKEEVWTEVVPGGPGIGLEDVFRKIGLAKVA